MGTMKSVSTPALGPQVQVSVSICGFSYVIPDFDPVDLDQVSPGQRIQRLLDARAVVVGLIRGRLRRSHPELSTAALNLQVLEEIDRAACFRISRTSWRP
jgi:hypothetical protein